MYGGSLGEPPSSINWSEYGFGLPPYKKIFMSALQAHKEAGLVMDLALGPNQGQGVPAKLDNDGLQWDLIPFSVTISDNGSFQGTIPGWGQGGNLVALTTALALVAEEIDHPPPKSSLPGVTGYNWTKFVVDQDSLADVTSSVDMSSGFVSITLPAPANNGSYQLTAMYEAKTLERSCITTGNPQTWLQNGSFTVDHFSAKGARVVADFWSEHLLDSETQALVQDVGNYLWEDSPEFKSHVNWTPDLPAVFEKLHGYKIQKILPLILFKNNNPVLQPSEPGKYEFVTNANDAGQSYVNDYRAALEYCYRQYANELKNWASTLHLQTSSQGTGNLPMDALATVPSYDAPETETLGYGGGMIDGMRQYAGPTYLSGKKVMSCEMGTQGIPGFQQHTHDLLFLVNRAVAGGVNQHVIHGQVYSGPYPNTTWPGFSAFNYVVSGTWSPRQPSWDHGFGDTLNYMARTSYIQQHGAPKTDVVFYLKESSSDQSSAKYQYTDLSDAGYTYQYLSPANFDLPQAIVENETLAASGPAYKALIIPSTGNMTAGGIKKITEYAQAGLPIILAGGIPNVYPESRNMAFANVSSAIEALVKMKNVYTSGEGALAEKLTEIGITPRISVRGSGTIFTTWRHAEDTKMDYAFVFSYINASSVSLTVATDKVPYMFDPWNGDRQPVLYYQRKAGSISIPLELAGNQTAVLVFAKSPLADLPVPDFWLTEVPLNVVGLSIDNSTGVLAKVANISEAGDATILTSSGKSISAQVKSVPPPFTIQQWNLTVEHWAPPDDLYDLSVYAKRFNTTHLLTTPLRSWTNITGLNETAGLGFYRSKLQWTSPGLGREVGAFIQLGPVVNTARLYVNGHLVPALDLTNPKADVTSYLKEGSNDILILTSTAYWNGIIPVKNQLLTSGANYLKTYQVPGIPIQEGLVGDVTVIPFEYVSIQG